MASEQSKKNYSVEADRWDFRVSDKAFSRIPSLKQAYKRMANDHPTGAEVMRDMFHGIVKSVPKVHDRKDINPEYWVNREVVNAAMALDEFESLKQMGVSDPTGASIAVTALEPELQAIFDRLKQAEEKAKELAEAMAEMEESMDEDGNPDEEAQALVDRLTEELDQELGGTSDMVQESLREPLEDLKQDAEALAEAASWGDEEGALTSTDPQRRMALAKKVRESSLPMVAEVFGRLMAMSAAATDQSHVDSPEEIYDIERGRDLNRMLPLELAFLDDEDLFYDWARRYTENNLMQYALHGTEDISKGGIIVLEDGSGSMGGDRGVLAKAMGLALLKIAKLDRREFSVVHFGSRGQFMNFDFDTTKEPITLDILDEHHSGIDAVLRYAQLNFQYGGTDFETPLKEGLRKLQKEFDETGRTSADLVMVTDGECYISEEFEEMMHQSKENLKFRVFGLIVDNYSSTSVLDQVCDVVFRPKNLLTGEGLEELMAQI